MSTSILEVIVLVAQRLDSASIPYMISGSLAANLYAEPRLTNDADIVVRLAAAQSTTLLDLFQHDFYITPEAIADAFAGVGMLNIIHQESVFKCDLILLKGDEFSQSAFARRQNHVLQNYSLAFMSLEDLILQKILWSKRTSSERQLRDVEKLIRTNAHALDVAYCRRWATLLGIEEDLKRWV
jgi:hypothetical protein